MQTAEANTAEKSDEAKSYCHRVPALRHISGCSDQSFSPDTANGGAQLTVTFPGLVEASGSRSREAPTDVFSQPPCAMQSI